MGIVTVTGRDELGRIIDVTLTTNADVAPPGPEVVPEGGGGAQTVTLLGPYHVTFETVGIDGSCGVRVGSLGDVPAGAVVIRAWAFITVGWDGADMFIELLPDDDVDDNCWNLVRYVAAQIIAPQEDAGIAQEGTASLLAMTKAKVSSHLRVQVSGASTGEADIYALIAEPSA